MTLHVFGAITTHHGTAANNCGMTEGNVATLQKILWNQQVHTTVSAETIRFALRRYLAERATCNRTYLDREQANVWADPRFERWAAGAKEPVFIDDDLFGYMSIEAARQDGDKGGARVRRGVLEVSRAVSLLPWSGDVTYNAASRGATPSAQRKGNNPVPYGTEMHATRYQYGFAMTPARLQTDKADRAALALEGLCALAEVAGNHGRFLFDFSPESVILRLTDDPAPRILYAFEQPDGGPVTASELLRKVRARDVRPEELIVGGFVVSGLDDEARAALRGASLFEGVRAACEAACGRIRADGRLA